MIYAEKAGFEPAIRFRRIHAFQACLFNHSSISPKRAQNTKKKPLPSFSDYKSMFFDPYITILFEFNF